MALEKVDRQVDLSTYPTEIVVRSKNDAITTGDAHASTLKVLAFLIENSVLKLNQGAAEYDRLRELYEREIIPGETTTDELDEILDSFCDIIESAKTGEIGLIRFIGDLMADRGNNDLLTLIILEHLLDRFIPIKNHFSNHDMIFVSLVESGEIFDKEIRWTGFDRVQPFQMRSLIGLRMYLLTGIIDKPRFEQLYRKYRSTLCLFSYIEGENENDLYFITHAASGIECIYEVFKLFYDDFSKTGLLLELGFPDNKSLHEDFIENCPRDKLITIMNALENIFSTKNIGALIKREMRLMSDVFKFERFPTDIPQELPIFRLCWNRSSAHIKKSKVINIINIHGHDLQTETISLDNYLAKAAKGGVTYPGLVETLSPEMLDAYRYGITEGQGFDVQDFLLTYLVDKVSSPKQQSLLNLGLFASRPSSPNSVDADTSQTPEVMSKNPTTSFFG